MYDMLHDLHEYERSERSLSCHSNYDFMIIMKFNDFECLSLYFYY